MDTEEKLHPTEPEVQNRIIEYLTKESGQLWFPPKSEHELHSHGVDIWLKGNKSGTRQFFIECKGRSNAKTEKEKPSISDDNSIQKNLELKNSFSVGYIPDVVFGGKFKVVKVTCNIEEIQ